MGDRTGLLGGDEGNWWQRRTKKEKGIVVGGVATFLAIIILVIVLTTTRKPTPATPTEGPTEPITPTDPWTESPVTPTVTTVPPSEPTGTEPGTTPTSEPTPEPTTSSEAPTTITESPTTSEATTTTTEEPTSEPTSASTEATSTEPATEPTTVTTEAPATTSTTESSPPTETTEPSSSTTEEPEEAICETETCIRESEAIRASMNLEAKPCDDFYEFACGKWSDHHSIPASEGRFTNFDLISKTVSQRLSDIFHENPEQEAKSLAFVRKLFRACNDTKTLDKDGIGPLKKLATAVMEHKWRPGLARAIGKHGLNAIVSVTVQPNPLNSTKFVVTLDQPSFGVGRQDLVNKTDEKAVKIKEAYTQLLVKNTAMFLNDEEAEKIVKDVVELETQLAAAAAPAAERRDVVKMTKTLLVSESKQTVPAFRWIDFVEEVIFQADNFESKLKDDDVVVINDLEYFKKISSIVSDETHAETLFHYIGLRVIQEFGFLSTNEVRNNGFELDKVVEGITEPHEQQTVLTERLVADVPSLVGRLYVDKHFTEAEQKAAESVIRKILDQYRVMLETSKWLGKKSTVEALAKIDNMQLNVGYANWIKKDAELDQ